MIQVLLGKKIEQTQKFLNDGRRIPVTQIAVPDNTVVQVKTQDKDKYTSIQIGIGKKKSPTKPLLGHAKKNNLTAVPVKIREVKIEKADSENMPKPGDFLKIEQVFKEGDIVDVIGISKGKGFAGVVKRHHFKGGPKTHGQSDRLRAPGSVGQTTTPGRVYRGKRMAGRMGQEIVTMKNLKVVRVDELNKTLYVSGLVPGVKNSIVSIVRKGQNKNFVPLYTPTSPKSTPESPKTEAKDTKPTEKTQEVKESKKGEKQEAKKS